MKTLEQRFWPKVVKAGDDECWLWTGSAGPSGHGALKLQKKHLGATALSWFLRYGVWPAKGLYVCHRCDNPPCVNPAHLFLGTQRHNMRDCIQKGRFKFLAAKTGESNPKAKLTQQRVEEARRRVVAGESIRALAAEYGIANSTLSEAVKGRTWRSPDITPRPKQAPSKGNGRIDKAEAVRMFQSGMKSSAIAASFGVSPTHMSIVLCRLGCRSVPFKPRSRRAA